MWTYRGNKKVCFVHPGTPPSKAVVTSNRRTRLVEFCPLCDELVEQLKKTKCTPDRYKKGK